MKHARDDLETYKRMFHYVLPYKVRLFSSFIFLGCASAFQAGISVVTYITVNGLINRDIVTFDNIPHMPPAIREYSFPASWIPFIIVFVFLCRGLFEYFSKYFMATVGLRALRDIRNDLYNNLAYQSCDFYTGRRAGDLISRIVNDVNNVNSAITTIIADCIKSPLTILWSIPFIFIMGGKLAWFSMAIFPVVVIPIALLGKRMRRLAKRLMERSADITVFLQETFLGMRIIKAFGMERREIDRFKEITKSVYTYEKKAVQVVEGQRPIIEVMGAIGVAITIGFAMRTLSPDRFMAFTAALFLLYDPFKKLSKINIILQRAIASGNRIFEIMDAPPSIVESANARKIEETIQEIRYDHIYFSYDGEKKVLNDFSLEIQKGEVVAFVGSSGAGKTTLINLLLRFYDPQQGAIRINGNDIRDFSLASLREQIGLVTQETILFNASIRENIAYGKPEASMKEVIAAAKAAHAHTFIEEKLENGYDTIVGEQGMLLSGGQRQRICIARAILKNPPILIFDEATSQLDSESEREVQAAIENLLKKRTVLVIAHRLSTIQNSSRIFVLDQGIVVESGSHHELLAKAGAYKRFCDMQLGN